MSSWDDNSAGIKSQDFLNDQDLVVVENSNHVELYSGNNVVNGQDIFSYSDPLKYSNQVEFKPLNINVGNTHFVESHYVDPYIRQDGTLIDGYYRDGDGNPDIDTPKNQGGGYLRSNPDGNPLNNLK